LHFVLRAFINEQIYLDQLLVVTNNEVDETTLNLLKSPPKSAKLSAIKLLQNKFDILMTFGDAKRLLQSIAILRHRLGALDISKILI